MVKETFMSRVENELEEPFRSVGCAGWNGEVNGAVAELEWERGEEDGNGEGVLIFSSLW